RVTSLPSSFAAKAPPSALEATKSTLSLRRTPLFFDRHARVFCASYVDGDPQPAAATAATRTRGNSSLRGCTAADCRTQSRTTPAANGIARKLRQLRLSRPCIAGRRVRTVPLAPSTGRE